MLTHISRLTTLLWVGMALCAATIAAPSSGLPACQQHEIRAEFIVVRTQVDLRKAYDVLAYDVALELDDQSASWSGHVLVDLKAGSADLTDLQLDAGSGLSIKDCSWVGAEDSRATGAKQTSFQFQHKKEQLLVRFPAPLKAGASGTLRVEFTGRPKHSKRNRSAVYWESSKTGPGRMDCSLQYAGAHNVFPCKSSFYHPEDVPDRSALSLTVPPEWIAIGPGSRVAVTQATHGRRTYRFELDHPTPTWALGFAAGPYQVRSMPWKGKHKQLNVEFYRLAGHEQAFDELAEILPSLLEHHERIFGAYPCPDSRLAVVETLATSSANATWVGVGTRVLDLHGKDKETPNHNSKAARILSHELGHAWWGHGLFVGSWRDNWLHESFSSYGALLYLGEQSGEDAMNTAFRRIAGDVSFKHRLALCDRASVCSATSITNALWFKGPWVLRTLRSQVNNDEQWFAALADFQTLYRSKTVSTDDFSQVLSKHTGESWDRFFEEWFEGSGLPCIVGTVCIDRNKLLVDLENRKDRILTRIPGKQDRNFHLSLKLEWNEGQVTHQKLLPLAPGANSWAIQCDSEPTKVKLVGLESILGPHEVRILPMPHSGLSHR